MVAVDADPENMRLLEMNADVHDVSDRIGMWTTWVENMSVRQFDERVRLVKSDVEGSEDEVIRVCLPLLERQQIDYMLLEISPVFKDFYPALVDECWVDDDLVRPQAGGFYGGWITPEIQGPFKGG